LLNTESILRVAEAFKCIKPCVPFIVRADPQFWAIHQVARIDQGYATYIIANALVSYQLVMPGEKYWMKFSIELAKSKPSVRDLAVWFKVFLAYYNPLARDAKLKRIEKLVSSNLYKDLASSPTLYCSELSLLRDRLVEIYRDPLAKTTLFAVKMYYYYCLASGLEAPLDYNIGIPVDRRNAQLTLKLKLLGGVSNNADALLDEHRDRVVEAWKIISRASGIPPLLIDTITWAILGQPTNLGELVTEDTVPEFCTELLRKCLIARLAYL